MLKDKLEPSLEGFGDCKTISRDPNVILGLFAPNRYNIPEHNTYDITVLKDNYRSLSILKYRDGEPNIKIPLYFDGAVDHFKELPPSDGASINKIYSELRKKH
jgi:hypothetical protein